MAKKPKVGHLPRYRRDDLTNPKLIQKRAWRHQDGNYECGKNITADSGNAVVMRYTTCANCRKAYDSWFRSQVEGDLHAKVGVVHLANTNMDPRSTVAMAIAHKDGGGEIDAY